MSEPVAESAENVRDAILNGRTSLGIELGSTRIKACLIGDDPATVLAVGGHDWENAFVDRMWTYSLDDVWSGLQAAYAGLVADVQQRYGVRPDTFGAIGVSAMMHGYLAFDADGELLVPFRTWRNTTTGPAAAELSELFGVNIPLRWSIAHLHQAVLDQEPHIPSVRHITTLAGYVHWRLTGRSVLGVGDASGMFPIDAATHDYDRELIARYDGLLAETAPGLGLPLAELLPEVLVAGEHAGTLTTAGAALLDPTGALRPGIALCPPEGDAGTGMVATGAVAPRTGNVSAGTSIFAMVVLERPLSQVHHELDLVTTPAGDPVAMVHCNNGASELAAWAALFGRFSAAAGASVDSDAVFDVLFREALDGDADAGGLLAYNYLAGEPIAGLSEGRPLVVRAPDSSFTLANFMRAQLYGVFGTLALGMRVLADEGVALDRMLAHGGLFRTAGVAQRFLAGALDAPVAVAETASEGGAWGIAVLASYLSYVEAASADDDEPAGAGRSDASPASGLDAYLRDRVFAGAGIQTTDPDPADVAGFAAYLDRYRAGLDAERAAVEALPLTAPAQNETTQSTNPQSTDPQNGATA
jgi:sugar (pentulose or hexulose) kinase